MKEAILGITLLYLLPAGVILKYGNRYDSGTSFIPIVNVVVANMIIGKQTWKYIHER